MSCWGSDAEQRMYNSRPQHVELLHIITNYYILLHTKFYSIPVQERFSPEET